jgi:predicted Zn-dependent protease
VVDDSVIGAIRSAVAAEPSNYALHVHLGELLLARADAPGALAEATAVLAEAPDDADALELAARAARAVGDETRAACFARLAAALSQAPAVTSTAPSEPTAADVRQRRRGVVAAPPRLHD